LITPYAARQAVDRVLENLGEDFYHDDIHCLEFQDDDTAVAGEGQESTDSDCDKPEEEIVAEVAGESAEGVESAKPEDSRVDSATLSPAQADAVHQAKATIAALEAHLEGLRAIGSVKAVQCIEAELTKERRKVRAFVKESPAVADAFLRLRRAEDQERLANNRIADQHRESKRDAAEALTDRDAAVAELRETKRRIVEMESVSACRHAIKTFTPKALGQGSANAGGPKGRKNRFEVLDRLARLRAGLSAGQKNDWPWFKEEWDKEMVEQHGADWADLFAKWMQNVLEDGCSNAFSTFVYNETCRVFHGTAALHVPGS
jgi:hypothetical protein